MPEVCPGVFKIWTLTLYWLRPRETVFCWPDTAVVARGEVEGNDGGRGLTKHTVSLDLSPKKTFVGKTIESKNVLC